jgi:hypothetical protein
LFHPEVAHAERTSLVEHPFSEETVTPFSSAFIPLRVTAGFRL